jgi:hypothetical protein
VFSDDVERGGPFHHRQDRAGEKCDCKGAYYGKHLFFLVFQVQDIIIFQNKSLFKNKNNSYFFKIKNPIIIFSK